MEKQNSTKSNTLSDKAFCRLMLSALISTLILIMIFCGTTYAWFTTSTATENNTILTGDFKLDVSATNSQLETFKFLGSVRGGDKVKSFTLAADDTYTVTIAPTADTKVSKGHAIITVGENTYITDTIYTDSETPFSFTITLSESTKVSVKASWGIAAQPTIFNNDVIELSEAE